MLLFILMSTQKRGQVHMTDPANRRLKQWRQERPDLDTSGLAIINRISMLSKLIRSRTRMALRPMNLETWEFEVLSALRRQGEPYKLPPTVLAKMYLLTTGAMTNRIDRLEKRNLVERKPDLEDRRGLDVLLTQKGIDLIDRAVEIRAKEAANLVGCLKESERVEPRHLLTNLLLETSR
jgi:DNA-binding MarR family transcriptional regulator